MRNRPDFAHARAELDRLLGPAPDPPARSTIHGTVNCYQAGCRCDDCKIASRDYTRARRGSLQPADLNPTRPDWFDDAACAGADPRLFFAFAQTGTHGDLSAAQFDALALCARCPVMEPCRTHARRFREQGIWGGETELDRARIGRGPVITSDAPAARAGRIARSEGLG